jgi:DNA segregation ATPase FtsK/SpoIIIE, S-DNA-T family
MRMTRRGLTRGYALPDDVRAMVVRRLTELAGIVLLLMAGFAALALASWNVQDPSLNHATAEPVRNVLGSPGAATADILMQLFGVGAVALLLPLALWGWRLLAQKSVDNEGLRVIGWLIGAACAAGFASSFTPTSRWPLPTGLGGVVGDWTFGVPAILFFARNSALGQSVLALVLGSAAFLALAVAGGFFFHHKAKAPSAPAMPIRLRGEPRPVAVDDEEGEESRSAPLGALMHWALSLKHMLSRNRVRAAREGSRCPA